MATLKELLRLLSYALTTLFYVALFVALVLRDESQIVLHGNYESRVFVGDSLLLDLLAFVLFGLIAMICSALVHHLASRDDKQRAVRVLAGYLVLAVVLHVITYCTVYTQASADFAKRARYWIRSEGECFGGGNWRFSVWDRRYNGPELGFAIMAYLLTMVSATLCFLHSSTLEGPDVLELLKVDFQSLRECRVAAYIPLVSRRSYTVCVREQHSQLYHEIPSQPSYVALVSAIGTEFRVPPESIMQITRGDVLISNDLQVQLLTSEARLEFTRSLTPTVTTTALESDDAPPVSMTSQLADEHQQHQRMSDISFLIDEDQ